MFNFRDSVTKVPLIGPKYKSLLSNLQIFTVKDLLYHFPSRYNDFSTIKPISDLKIDEISTIRGEIIEIKNIFTKNGKKLTIAVISDNSNSCQLVWFNQMYITRNISSGDVIDVSGKVSVFNNKISFTGPEYELSTDHKGIHTARLVPVYPETEKLSSKWLRSRINYLLTNTIFHETLPEELVVKYGFLQLKEALFSIHFPHSSIKAGMALDRFKYEELFEISLLNEIKRREVQNCSLNKIITQHNQKIEEFIKLLPFSLTNSQVRASNEILSDLIRSYPMNRLLQGDVGSGKTVVACIASFLLYLNRTSVFLMAPTEILANQHYQTFKEIFKAYDMGISLFTGSIKQDPKADIVIGTHALYKGIKDTSNLGLLIIDEQHRFGVKQREALIQSQGSKKPHLLTMTATPIPRTLALTVYGNLDISTLNELPSGRQKVITWVIPKEKRESGYEWVKNQILVSRGKMRAFVVCPLIDESEHETMKNIKAAKIEHEYLSNNVFKGLRVGLLHGKLSSKEKGRVMESFRNGKLDVLVATPVIEVGLDIKSASFIIIEGSERFGLATLHQMRGRVGRSNQKSYCLLFNGVESEKAVTRLKHLEKENNGLKLSELDLKLRGPGELYGTLQHGRIQFKVATIEDISKLEEIKSDAVKIINSNKQYMDRFYKNTEGNHNNSDN